MTVWYNREIKNRQDQITPQKDLNLLENWGSKWGKRFNAAKCNNMQMSRKQAPISTQYELSGQVLEEVKDAKYLGVTVSDDFEWTKHINAITTKANSKFLFLRRNLKGCPKKTKGNRLPRSCTVLPRIQRHCLAPPPKVQLR